MEVATLAGGALLSATFELLLSKLNSSTSELLNLPKKIHAEMQNWKSLLPKIGALIEAAEEKQARDCLVKLWLADLKELFYDMDDILEAAEIDAMRSKLFAKAQASSSKPLKIAPKLFNKVSRFMVEEDQNMASRVVDITTRLRHIEENITTLGLISSTMKTRDKSCKVAVERVHTTPLPECEVYGRENDKEAILQMLLDEEGKHEPYSVIPIVGMGGIGKTTLARLIYNDKKLKGRFGLKAWVCISEEFDVYRVTRAILEQVSTKMCDLKDLSLLQERLKQKLSSKIFLLILDDVWNKNYELWDNFQRPFLSGASGSIIIVTTRDENIGKMMKGTDKVYDLALLEDDACLSLFARHALGVENFDAYPNLRGVGKKIVERCKRLPLALKTLGGLLRGKLSHDEWEDILKSEIWGLPEDISGILPALRLSYNYLPSHLKRCFAYCSLFPKDYEFEKGELVLLWMAEGLLQRQPPGMKKMHDIGHQYFHDLVSRAFFQRSSKDESSFVMHDLIVDLSLYVTRETYCTLETDGKISNGSFEKARHLSLLPCTYEVSKRFELLEKKKNLRTFLWLDSMDWKYNQCYLSNTLLQDLMTNLKCLRVLSLPGCSITKLSDSIGDLKHLRYINLSNTNIVSLPDSVGYLIYLQTLLLRYCSRLSKLLATIGNLLDLQHLDIIETPSLKEIPSEIISLKSLVTLPKFVVGNVTGPRLKDLKNLSCIQGHLSIFDLHNVLDANEAKDATLCEFKGLDDLSLEWSPDSQNSQNGTNEKQVLKWLKPHQALKRLSINSFGGLELPRWIGDPSFTNLEFLKLNNCQRSTSLPSLERLPQLKELIITGMHAAQTMMLEFDGDNSSSTWAFPALKSLELQNCPMLVGNFPKCIPFLKKLEITRCPKLIYSSVSLPSLEELYIGECSEAVLRSMVDLNSLKTLRINRISKLTWLPKSFVESLIALEDMEIEGCDDLTCLQEERANLVNLARLKRMRIMECCLLVSLTGKKQSFPPEALESLPSEVMMMVQLEELHIIRCPALRMFPRGKLPTKLKVLKIEECENLESLPEGMLMNNGDACQVSHLEELVIDRCPCLKSFPSGHLPNSLKHLAVGGCKQLEFIPQRMLQYCTELEHIYINDGDINMDNYLGFRYMNTGTCSLWIENCDGLESFCLSIPNLKRLTIQNCKNLKSLPDMLQDLTSLDGLKINYCPGIESIPDGGLPPNLTALSFYGLGIKSIANDGLPPNLRSLNIYNCPRIESIPNSGLPPNLTDFAIVWCPRIESVPNGGLPSNLTSLEIFKCPGIDSIPDSGFPPNLRRLGIHCKNLKKPMQEWGLSSLTSLLSFTICWICPPDDVLPTSLTSLVVAKVENMKSISRGLLRNLNSLQELWIECCPKLQLLPKEGLPPSLQSLTIRRCPNFQSLPNKVLPPSLQYLDIVNCRSFQSLPKEGLPPSLQQLWILNCPMLKRRCLEEKGDYWPLIAHIPDISIWDDDRHTSSETKQKICLCFKTGCQSNEISNLNESYGFSSNITQGVGSCKNQGTSLIFCYASTSTRSESSIKGTQHCHSW